MTISIQNYSSSIINTSYSTRNNTSTTLSVGPHIYQVDKPCVDPKSKISLPTFDIHQLANLEYLRKVQDYKKNWNCYNADPFSPEFIKKVRDLVINLLVQPIIMPTGRSSIIFSFRMKNVNELVIELFEYKVSILKIFGSVTDPDDEEFISESYDDFDDKFITRFVEDFVNETSFKQR